VIVHRGDESVSPDATRLDVREFRDMLQDALRDHPTEDDKEIPGIERLAPAS
jgi:hypothetical protein